MSNINITKRIIFWIAVVRFEFILYFTQHANSTKKKLTRNINKFKHFPSSPPTILRFPEVTAALLSCYPCHVAAKGGLAHEGQDGKAQADQAHEKGPTQVGDGQGFRQRLRAKFEELLFIRPNFKAY